MQSLCNTKFNNLSCVARARKDQILWHWLLLVVGWRWMVDIGPQGAAYLALSQALDFSPWIDSGSVKVGFSCIPNYYLLLLSAGISDVACTWPFYRYPSSPYTTRITCDTQCVTTYGRTKKGNANPSYLPYNAQKDYKHAYPSSIHIDRTSPADEWMGDVSV
jgi:hypothetical protein